MKEKDDTEKAMKNFLEMLEKDEKELGAEFVLKYISRMVYDSLDMGSKGFQPILNLTLFVRQDGLDTDFVFRPTRGTNQELYEMFKIAVLGQKMMDAYKEYGEEVWGMTPVDEREDKRVHANELEKFNLSWGHLKGE